MNQAKNPIRIKQRAENIAKTKLAPPHRRYIYEVGASTMRWAPRKDDIVPCKYEPGKKNPIKIKQRAEN